MMIDHGSFNDKHTIFYCSVYIFFRYQAKSSLCNRLQYLQDRTFENTISVLNSPRQILISSGSISINSEIYVKPKYFFEATKRLYNV